MNPELLVEDPAKISELVSNYDDNLRFVHPEEFFQSDDQQDDSIIFLDTELVVHEFDVMTVAINFVSTNPTTFYSTDLDEIVSYDKIHGVYRILTKEQFASMVQEFVRTQRFEINSAGNIDSAVKVIKRLPEFQRDVLFNSDPFKFCVRNCIVDCEGGIVNILPHTQEFYSTIQYDVNYDSSAVANTFIRVLSEILPDQDKQEFIKLWMAYTLLPNYKFQKILLQFGTGRDGKDTIWFPIRSILTAKNFSTLSTHDIANREFMLHNLKNKLANFSSEQKIGILQQDKIKQITGGNLITADKKFSVYPTTFYNKAKIILNSNTLPEINEINTSTMERYQVIHFTEKFTGDRVDTGLEEKITSDTEKSGILNMLLGIIPTLFRNNSIYFEAPEIVQKETAESFSVMSGLGEFIEQHLVLGSGKEIAADVYTVYLRYASENKLKAISKPKFNNLIVENCKVTKAKSTGNQTYFFGLHLV